jgi:hypothetical protein
MTWSRAHALAAAIALLLVLIGLALATSTSNGTAVADPCALREAPPPGVTPVDCVELALPAEGEFTREEIERAIAEVRRRARSQPATPPVPAVKAPPGAIDAHPEIQVIR